MRQNNGRINRFAQVRRQRLRLAMLRYLRNKKREGSSLRLSGRSLQRELPHTEDDLRSQDKRWFVGMNDVPRDHPETDDFLDEVGSIAEAMDGFVHHDFVWAYGTDNHNFEFADQLSAQSFLSAVEDLILRAFPGMDREVTFESYYINDWE